MLIRKYHVGVVNSICSRERVIHHAMVPQRLQVELADLNPHGEKASRAAEADGMGAMDVYPGRRHFRFDSPPRALVGPAATDVGWLHRILELVVVLADPTRWQGAQTGSAEAESTVHDPIYVASDRWPPPILRCEKRAQTDPKRMHAPEK